MPYCAKNTSYDSCSFMILLGTKATEGPRKFCKIFQQASYSNTKGTIFTFTITERWEALCNGANNANLCTAVTLGEWQGDRYIQGDCYVQANFAENVRQLKILGSCLVTVSYWVTAIYRTVLYSFDYNIIIHFWPFLIQVMFVLFCSKTWYISQA